MKISCTNQALSRSTLTGILFTVLLGSLLHFTYEWSGHLTAVSLFSAVNESTWEHLKLLFMPMFLYSAAETLFLGRCFPGLMKARVFGCIAGMFIFRLTSQCFSSVLRQHFCSVPGPLKPTHGRQAKKRGLMIRPLPWADLPFFFCSFSSLSGSRRIRRALESFSLPPDSRTRRLPAGPDRQTSFLHPFVCADIFPQIRLPQILRSSADSSERSL